MILIVFIDSYYSTKKFKFLVFLRYLGRMYQNIYPRVLESSLVSPEILRPSQFSPIYSKRGEVHDPEKN